MIPPSASGSGLPATSACSGDAGACLFGTAKASGFSRTPALTVNLYRVFPSGSFDLVQQQLVASQLVAADGTWAFSGREVWAHYYVQLVATVQPTPSAVPSLVSTLVGPLSAPSEQAQSLEMGPVFGSVLQSNGVAGGQEIDEVSAQVYDPVTGQVVSDAAVSIAIGDASLPLPWDPEAGTPSYRATFESGTPAQPGYTVSSSSWDGAAELLAPSPSPVGAITAPEGGESVSADAGTFAVDWALEPSADFEVVELFTQTDGGWTPIYLSPAAIAPDVGNTGSLSDEGLTLDPGAYLVNVAYVRAACAQGGGGCVQAGSVATETFGVTP